MDAQRLENGKLLVPVRLEGNDGFIGEGLLEIDESHPDFAAWEQTLPLALDGRAYKTALAAARLRLGITFDENRHPRGPGGRFRGVAKTIKGFHGVSKDEIVGDFHHPELYIGPPHVAGAYGEESGVVLPVEFKAKNALVLDTADKAIEAWEASGADKTGGSHFHGDGEGVGDHFARWAREQGYDAVEITPYAFYEDERGDPVRDIEWTDEVQRKWDEVAGRWGEPQTIILDPTRAKFKR